MAKEQGRGMTPAKEKFWKEQNNKADDMKIRWFAKNKDKLQARVDAAPVREKLSENELEEMEQNMINRYRNAVRFGRKRLRDADWPEVDPKLIIPIMKPVAENVKKILYTNMEKQGTNLYLKKVYKNIPEDRFYYPECSSFDCGWKIAESQKILAEEVRLGRRQVIKNEFYRRHGVLSVDPPFYREPIQTGSSRRQLGKKIGEKKFNKMKKTQEKFNT